MAPHSSTLAWRILWTEEPGRLQSMGSLGVRHDWATSLSLFTFMHWRRKWQPTPVFLLGESQGRVSLMGCHLWRRTESDTPETTYQQQQQQPQDHSAEGPFPHGSHRAWLSQFSCVHGWRFSTRNKHYSWLPQHFWGVGLPRSSHLTLLHLQNVSYCFLSDHIGIFLQHWVKSL